jgi:hypothetical protein
MVSRGEKRSWSELHFFLEFLPRPSSLDTPRPSPDNVTDSRWKLGEPELFS